MAGGFQSSDDDTFSGINITPLVDVVLVLLIIFLITAPVLYQSAIKVQLPKAVSGESQGKSEAMSFSLTKEGELLHHGKPLEWARIPEALKGLDRNEPVLVNADQATAHGTVVRLMDVLRQEGFGRFALTVEQVKK